MVNLINDISNFIVKSLFEAHRVFLIATILCIGLFSTNEINNISLSLLFLFTFLVLIVSYIITGITFKNSDGETNYRKLSSILGLIISFILVLFIRNTSVTFKAFYFFYFVILWINGIKIYFDSYDSSSYTQKFIISIVVILITSITISITHWDWISENLSRYFLPYLFIWLILMSRMNLHEAYSSNEKNSIDKSKNTLKFNILTLILIAFISLPSFLFKFNPKNLISLISKGFYYILLGFGYIFTMLYNLIGKFTHSEERYTEFQKKLTENLGEETQQELDFLSEPYRAANITVEVLKWIFIIAFAILLTVYIYNLLKDSFKSNKESNKGDEIKDFILTKEDLLNSIKSPFSNLYKNISNIFKREHDDNKLPTIRKLYCDSLIFFSNKGYEFKKYFTPNEYLDSISEEKYKDNSFDKLTNYYNKARYGGKVISSEEENDAINIVNELTEINHKK